MSNTRIDVLFPTGRVVQGDLYKAQDKDGDGKPLVVKSGPNQGKPTVKYFFAVAIPKKPGEAHWGSTDWGAKIWALGHSTWPNGQAQAPTFAWKVDDGAAFELRILCNAGRPSQYDDCRGGEYGRNFDGFIDGLHRGWRADSHI